MPYIVFTNVPGYLPDSQDHELIPTLLEAKQMVRDTIESYEELGDIYHKWEFLSYITKKMLIEYAKPMVMGIFVAHDDDEHALGTVLNIVWSDEE